MHPYLQRHPARLWLAGALLLGACQSPPAGWPAGRVFKTRGHLLTYRAEHFEAAGTRPFLVDTITITVRGTRLDPLDPHARGEDTTRQWGAAYGYRDVTFGATGVLENDTALWLHPPRYDRYRILELTPFPYIKLPVGQPARWTWNLIVGDGYADARWATWRGRLVVASTYRVAGRQVLTTPLGPLTCWRVRARARCPVGTSTLTSYYHPQIGFVRLAYRTIDRRRLTLSLVDTARVALPMYGPTPYAPKAWQLSAS